MFPLTTTTDQINVVTANAVGPINMYAGWADVDASKNVTIGRTVANPSTATTTVLVAAPASGHSINAKNIKISNDSASSQTVTIRFSPDGGTTNYIIESVTLGAGERIGYQEGVGFRVFDSSGREKIQSAQTYPGNANTADVVANAADQYLTGSSLLIANRLQVGATFRWVFRATKTAAGTAAPIFNVRLGTAGAVGDTARAVHTGVVQTAVTDTGWFELEGSFQVVGSSAVLNTILRMDHLSADAAGMGTFRYVAVKSAAFDATPAGTIIGVSCNPGASGVWTFQQVSLAASGLIV